MARMKHNILFGILSILHAHNDHFKPISKIYYEQKKKICNIVNAIDAKQTQKQRQKKNKIRQKIHIKCLLKIIMYAIEKENLQ